MKTPRKTEREEIFRLFLYADRLSFSQIEKAVGMRSNLLAYHLDRLIKEGILQKECQSYRLTSMAERHIPLSSQHQSPLPIILIAVTEGSQVLLLPRAKRPYKGHWSLPGGRIRTGESLEDAARRIVQEKTGIAISQVTFRHIMHEQVGKKYGFIILFATAFPLSTTAKDRGHGRPSWFPKQDLPEHMIPSDQWLVEEQAERRLRYSSHTLEEQGASLENSRISLL